MNKVCLTLALILSLWLPSYSQTAADARFKIAVICHILHQGQAVGTGSNLSAAQVRSQFIVLNQDFNRRNPDTVNTPAVFRNVAASLEVHFEPAKIASDGTVLAEPGINRIQVPLNSYATSQVDSLRRALAWNPDEYLNIYVVKFAGELSGTGGFSSLPSYSTLSNIPVVTLQYAQDDGIFVQPSVFGSNYTAEGNSFALRAAYERGRVLTHEVGHYLGLRHIWGNGDCNADDGVDDTPAASTSHHTISSACNSDVNTCGAGSPNDLPDMYQNYMDYTRESCMNLFTQGQKERVWTVLTKAFQRKNLDANYFHLTTIGTERDSLILVDFYKAMDGSNWKQTWNLAQPLHTWYGVSMQAGRVTKLQLPANRLKGTFPAKFKYLDSLQVLELQSNLLHTLPNLTGLNITSLKVQKNYLGLDDLEPNAAKLGSTDTYSPQYLGVGKHYLRNQNSDFTFTAADLGGSGHTYQWYHKNSLLVGQNSNSLLLRNLQAADTGAYYCEIGVNSRIVADLAVLSKRDTLSLNYVPTAISISNAAISEIEPIGTVVGTLSTTDPSDPADHTYKLIDGDTTQFNLAGATLKTAVAFNYELKKLYTITVRTTDSGGLSFSQELELHISNVNDRSLNITLSNTSIAENSPIDTLIGKIRTIDPDSRDSHTYTLGGADSTAFSIFGDRLRVAEPLNFETRSVYNIAITSRDRGGSQISKAFRIVVQDVGEAPTDLRLSKTTLLERSPVGTAVGVFSTVDEDIADRHVYTITGADASNFTIDGDTLKVKTLLAYGRKTRFDLTAEVTDSTGFKFRRDFQISLIDVNHRPSAISVSDTTIAENSPVNTLVGILTTTDSDYRDSHVYLLTGGDVRAFSIFRNRLEIIRDLDFETQSVYNITISSQDRGGLQISKAFSIKVEDVNEAPTNLVLSNTAIAENSPLGTVIGRLSTTDVDGSDQHTYTLSGVDADSFNIVGSNLVVASHLDFETDTLHNIKIKTTDRGGLNLTKDFTIKVRNLIETRAGLRRLDSLSLVALYDSAGGSSWTRRWNLNQPLDTWHGVQLQDERVMGLNLKANNLRGRVPKSLDNLVVLQTLDLSDNSLNSLATLTDLANLNRFEIQNNSLSFEALIPNRRLLGAAHTYSPQAYTYSPARYYDLQGGEDTTLFIALSDPHKSYQWYRNNKLLAGKTDTVLELTNIRYNLNDGVYYCAITNSNLPGLTLRSGTYRLVVPRGLVASDSLALVALYDSTDGANWKTQWDFNQPAETWHGVTVEGNRVTKLNLSDNNMRGRMPAEMENLVGLQVLDLSSNYLTHLVLPLAARGTASGWLSYRGTHNWINTLIPRVPNYQLNIDHNHFDFKDIKRYFGPLSNLTSPVGGNWIANTLGDGISYNMHDHNSHTVQRPIRDGKYSKKFTYVDDDLELDLPSSDQYEWTGGDYFRWYRNNHEVAGEHHYVLRIDSLIPEHEGIYQLRVRNRSSYQFTFRRPYAYPHFRYAHSTSPIILESAVDTVVVETLAPREYEALKALYERTDGDNWTNSWDTLMTGSHKWYGVELTEDGHHVKGLRLQNNNLVDTIPDALARLDSLKVLYLQDNDLTYLADLSNLDSLQDFKVADNRLHFDHIRPNLVRFKYDSARYSPQWLRAGKRYATIPGDSLVLGVQVRGAGNRYRWLKYDTLVVASVDSLQLTPIVRSDAGLYHCAVRHGTVPGLVLRSGEDIVVVRDLSESDSLALVALYNSTAGANWHKTWDLRRPVSTWYGVGVNDGRVRKVALAANNLVGVLPPEIANLEVDTFEIQTNRLKNLYLPRLRSAYTLKLASNYFDFGDLEPHKTKFDTASQYAPQRGLLRAGAYYEREPGTSLTLRVAARGSANRYQWFFKTNPKAGANSNDLVLTNIGRANTGKYFCRVSNSDLPGLILESGLDTLVMGSLYSDSLALVSLYNQTDGANWKKTWDLNAPIATWAGVELRRGRVSALRLAANGLRGTVPADLNTVSLLKVLQLADNVLDSMSDLTDLANLEDFRIESNWLDLADVAPNLALFDSAKYYSPQIIRSGRRYKRAIGSAFDLKVGLKGSGHTYQWFLDGKVLSGKTSASLRIDSVSPFDIGQYHCEVFHPTLPKLKRISLPDTLDISKLSRDSLALVALYKSTDGPNWRIKWDLSQPINTWYGVRIKKERVDEVRLYTNNLDGTLPPEIGYLDKLTILELSDNKLRGALPTTIGKLENLHTLNIFTNQLSGDLPAELSDLANLITLDLADNKFSGTLAPAIVGLRELTSFYFMNNDFSGPIPPAIGGLTNLVRVDGENNRLSGTIPPTIGNLINLENLFLCNNELTGPIPPEVGRLTNLQIMYLCNNDLSDSIPAEIGDLINLVKLNLAGNKLAGALPSSITNLDKLTHLWVEDNKLDSIPDLSGMVNLVSVAVNNNRLDFESIAKLVDQIGSKLTDLTPGDAISMTIRRGKFYIRPYGDRLILVVNVRGAGNFYQWYFNDVELPGATSSSLTVSNIQVADTGLYHCEVHNARVSDMVLTSLPDTLEMLPLSLDSLALVDLYHSAGGVGWRAKWNLNQPLDNWQGVSISGIRNSRLTSARVAGLDLAGRGLVGALPPTMSNLSALTHLDLSSNPALKQLKPLETLSNLRTLALAKNGLDDSHILDLTRLRKITSLNLADNHFTKLPIGIQLQRGLKKLWLQNNELKTLPDLSVLTDLHDFKVENNRLDFQAVKPYLAALRVLANYNPQRIGYGGVYYREPADSLNLKTNSVRGTGHRYSWYHNAKLTLHNDSLLKFAGLDFKDRGLYRYEVRNALVPGLVLTSIPDTLILRRSLTARDSLALVRFYYATAGRFWKQVWDLNASGANWRGVKTSKGRVSELVLPANRLDGHLPHGLDSLDKLTKIDFTANYLTGRVPSGVAKLNHLDTLYLGANTLNKLPDFSSLSNLKEFKVDRNALHFADLEPNIAVLNYNNSRYDSQTIPNTWFYRQEPASQLTLHNNTRGKYNSYRWFYNENLIAGKTDSVLKLNQLGIEHGGLYQCVITNSKVPGLIYTMNYHVEVMRTVTTADSLALVALYRATSGSDWKTSWNLNEPITKWAGVSHAGGRVSKIDLSNNLLRGSVPAAVRKLTALKTLHLQDNALANLADLSTLTELNDFKVQNNRLDFEDIKPNLVRLANQASNYHPQTIRNGQRYEEASSGNWSVGVRVTGSGLTYQWYRDGLALAGQIHNSLSIFDLKPHHTGLYHCEVRNVLVPDLILSSRPDTLLVNRTVSMVDSLALVAFYNSTAGSNWTNSWNLNDPVKTWFGISIDSGRVSKIELNNNNLNGSLPLQINLLTGLQVFKLDSNRLKSAVPDLLSVQKLRVLHLAHNTLTYFPDLSSLTALEDLRLQNNRFHFADLEPNLKALQNDPANYSPQAAIRVGVVYRYPHYPTRLTVYARGTTNYQWYFNNQPISSQNRATLDFFPPQKFLKDTYFATLTNSKVPGLTLKSRPDTLVMIGTAIESDSLILVDFYRKTGGSDWTKQWDFAQPVKTWAGVKIDNGKVTHLELPANNITGDLTVKLGGLDKLTVLNLEGNKISGNLPDTLENVPLQRLNLARNNLTGILSRDLNRYRELEHLDLSSNQLSGPIPPTLSYLTNLKTLNLADNQFGGGIPADFGQFKKLKDLNLDANALRSNIPTTLANLKTLEVLSLANNRLTGFLPANLGNLSNLKTLNLNANFLTGAIPSSLGNLDSLVRLNLASNQLKGNLPVSLGDLRNLEFLNLGNNQLAGVIPAGLGSLGKLTYLGLEHNNLSGAIPAALENLAQLKTLHLHNNALTSMPAWIWWKLLNLRDLRVQYNYLTAADLEPNIRIIGQSARYSPQLIRLGKGYTREIGEALDLTVAVRGTGNVYQWYFGERILADGVNSTLNLHDLELYRTGLYHCRVTNSAVPRLVMQSLPDTLEVTNAAPTSLQLSSVTIKENLPGGSLVGLLTATDANASDRHTYSLSGVDARHFKLEGNRLLSSHYFDYEMRSNYQIEITVMDRGGSTLKEAFKIEIIDEVDGNQEVAGSNSNVGGSAADISDQDSPEAADLPVPKMTVYPNPSAGIIRIKGLDGLENLQIQVLNAVGSVVALYKTAADSYDLSHLPKGIYVVIIEADGKMDKYKLILK